MEKKQKKPSINFSLRNYLDDRDFSLRQFARLCNVSHNTLYPIYKGWRNPRRRLALKICKNSEGALKLTDFGVEDDCIQSPYSANPSHGQHHESPDLPPTT